MLICVFHSLHFEPNHKDFVSPAGNDNLNAGWFFPYPTNLSTHTTGPAVANHSIYASRYVSVGIRWNLLECMCVDFNIRWNFSLADESNRSVRSASSFAPTSVLDASLYPMSFPADHFPLAWDWSNKTVAGWERTLSYLNH
jgi:hypothetical protein